MLRNLRMIERGSYHHDEQVPCEPTYQTGFGTLTFTQLHDNTRNLAAHIMRQTYGIDNHDDIDDCLQFGYWKLWEKLERDPTFTHDKGPSYIARSVCFRAKRERYRNIRHRQRTQVLPEEIHPAGYAPHSRESREVDRRVDLERAIVGTAEFFADEPTTLLALYYVLTDVTGPDLRELGLSRHTLRDHALKARSVLRSHLKANI